MNNGSDPSAADDTTMRARLVRPFISKGRAAVLEATRTSAEGSRTRPFRAGSLDAPAESVGSSPDVVAAEPRRPIDDHVPVDGGLQTDVDQADGNELNRFDAMLRAEEAIAEAESGAGPPATEASADVSAADGGLPAPEAVAGPEATERAAIDGWAEHLDRGQYAPLAKMAWEPPSPADEDTADDDVVADDIVDQHIAVEEAPRDDVGEDDTSEGRLIGPVAAGLVPEHGVTSEELAIADTLEAIATAVRAGRAQELLAANPRDALIAFIAGYVSASVEPRSGDVR